MADHPYGVVIPDPDAVAALKAGREAARVTGEAWVKDMLLGEGLGAALKWNDDPSKES